MPPTERVNLRKVKKTYPAYKLYFDYLLNEFGYVPSSKSIFFKELLIVLVRNNNNNNSELAFINLKNFTVEFMQIPFQSDNPISFFVNYKNESVYIATYDRKLYRLKNKELTFITTLELPTLYFSETWSSLLCKDDKLYCICGKEVIEYDILKNTQSKIASLEKEFDDSCAFVTDKSIQILGGVHRHWFREVFDFSKKVWTKKELGSSGNYKSVCTIWNEKLYVITSDNAIKVGDIEGGEISEVDYRKFYLTDYSNSTNLLSDENGLYAISGGVIDVLATKGIYADEDTFLY